LRRRRLHLGLALGGSSPLLLVLALLGPLAPAARVGAQSADVNAEARVFFEEGNRRFAEATGRQGARRRALLDEALQSYVASVRIVRSRNALFNAAAVLQELERFDEAFAYYAEYLAIPGLSSEERGAGEARMRWLQPRVAIVRVVSDPPGAEVMIDRLDLAARGRAPLSLALPPGAHAVYLRLVHHQGAELQVVAERGETRTVSATLEPLPRPLRVVLPAPGRLSLDGAPLEPEASIAPGEHLLRFDPERGESSERRLVVEPGDEEVLVRFEPPAGADRATLLVRSEPGAEVLVDGASIGTGAELSASLEPGPHAVIVRAPGRLPLHRRIRLEAGRSAALDVTLSRPSEETRMGSAPTWLFLGTLASAAAWTGLGIRHLGLQSDYDTYIDRNCARGCAADTEALSRYDSMRTSAITTDVLLGLTGLMAITTLTIFLLDRPLEAEPSQASFGLIPLSGGALGVAELRWGLPAGGAP
ncbi:MAG: PEGA domain-containing protein, partial [Myxococcales bacterium]|nr:PEGA domain-containing protein [Myxococcales bacterium]